jgi:integrase
VSKVFFPVELVLAAAEELPFKDGSFDAVVSTLVFCTVANPPIAFKEVRRVLKTSGEFRLLEHVKMKREPIGWLQGKATPLCRTVKLTQTATEALKSHRVRQNEERLRAGTQWADMDLVFPNKRGKPMDANNLYHRDWKGLLRRAGLPDSFTFHTCRHTFATTLLRQNVNPKIVQHQLGHATISQTMDTYSHVMPEMGDVAADALGAALS